MADAPKDYDAFNPQVVMDHDGDIYSTTLHMEVFNPDGSPNQHTLMSDEEASAKLKLIFEALGKTEMRDMLHLVALMHSQVRDAAIRSHNELHSFIHSVQLPEGIDEDTLCEGIKSYFAPPKEAEVEEKITPETKNMLADFFPDKSKPN